MPDSCGLFLSLITGVAKMDERKNIAFNFGENWRRFSENRLDNRKFEMALSSLEHLIGREKIKDSTFLDIGCGIAGIDVILYEHYKNSNLNYLVLQTKYRHRNLKDQI